MKLRTKLSLMLAFLSAVSLFLNMSFIGLAWHGNGGGP